MDPRVISRAATKTLTTLSTVAATLNAFSAPSSSGEVY
jgi:hypothetical protein